MKEKELLFSIHEFFGVSIGQKIELLKGQATEAQDKSIYSLKVPFVCIIEGDGKDLPLVLSVRFGKVPKGFASLLEKRNPFTNKCDVLVSGNKLPEITLNILIEK